MKIQRVKPYKANNPISTIENIRKTLSEIGIFTTETHFSSSISNLYSCNVKISNENIDSFEIGTNGKGLTKPFSLASAYGELMERLQNNLLFRDIPKYASKKFLNASSGNSSFVKRLEKDNLILDFIHAPDEIYPTFEQLNKNYPKVLNKLLPFDQTTNNSLINDFIKQEVVCVPFYSHESKEVINLPIEMIQMLCGSNGMSAGNTKKEALIQEISEILERYAVSEIFNKEITPPTIPEHIFQDTEVYDRLITLKKETNYSYYIKDCSLGIGIPVIGLLLIDHERNKYHFDINADPSIITALERCLTETYQGAKSYCERRYKEINISKDPFFQRNGKESLKTIEFNKIVIDGTGKWPNSIFGSEATYPFSGFEHQISKSDDEDFTFLINKINKLGHDIFLRDVSYLGFNAFHVFIPGMSDVFRNLLSENDVELYKDVFEDYFKIDPLHNLRHSSQEQLISVINNLGNDGPVTFFPYSISDENEINVFLLKSMLFYYLKNYAKSYSYMDYYINSEKRQGKTIDSYYYCARDFIFLRSMGKTTNEINQQLLLIFDQTLLDEISEDLENESDVFKYSNIPNCLDCENCDIYNECKFIEIIKIIKKLQLKYKSNMIDQHSLNELF